MELLDYYAEGEHSKYVQCSINKNLEAHISVYDNITEQGNSSRTTHITNFSLSRIWWRSEVPVVYAFTGTNGNYGFGGTYDLSLARKIEEPTTGRIGNTAGICDFFSKPYDSNHETVYATFKANIEYISNYVCLKTNYNDIINTNYSVNIDTDINLETKTVLYQINYITNNSRPIDYTTNTVTNYYFIIRYSSGTIITNFAGSIFENGQFIGDEYKDIDSI